MTLPSRPSVMTYLQELVRELFTAALMTYLVFALIDTLTQNLISNVFSMNVLLWFTVVVGVLAVFVQQGESEKRARTSFRFTPGTIVMMTVLSIVGGAVVWLRAPTLHGIALILGILAALIIAALSFLLLRDEDENAEATHHQNGDPHP